MNALRGTLKWLRHATQRPQGLLWEWQVMRACDAFARRYPFLRAPEPGSGRRRVLILNLNTGHFKAQVASLLAKAVELRGYTPVVLTYRWCRRAERAHRAFGVRDFRYFDDAIADAARRYAQEIRRDLEGLLAHADSVQAVKRLQYRGVGIGRATLSSIARSLLRGRLEMSDAAIRRMLRDWLPLTMQRVRAAEAVLDAVRPDLLLLHEKGYMAEAPVFEAALNRGIDTIFWCHAHRDDALNFRRYTAATRYAHWLSLSSELSRSVAASYPWSDAREQELMEDFATRYQASAWFLSRRYQDGKSVKNPEEVRRQLGLDPSKKTAVLFSHMTWDASFFHGEDLFEDYEDWLVETIRVACRNPALNWIIKLHPGNVFKRRAEGIRGECSELVTIRNKVGPLPPHVKLLEPDTDLNTFSLFPVTDYCLTVRGTIGIEMACFGIPVLTAGTGRYSGLSFTIDSPTRAAYLAALATLQTQPRLTPEQMLRAKRYAYVLFRRRPALFTSFRTIFRETLPPSHPFFWDFALALDSRDALARAPDLAAFAQWATTSRTEDFIMEDWMGPAEAGAMAGEALVEAGVEIARHDAPAREWKC